MTQFFRMHFMGRIGPLTLPIQLKPVVLLIFFGVFPGSGKTQPEPEWSKCLGGNYIDTPNQILQTADGGYLVVGETESTDDDVTGSHGARDAWVVKLNSSHDTEWAKAFGGSQYDSATDVVETSDGNFIIAGYSNSNDGDVSGRHGSSYDCWIVMISQTGQLLWQRMYGGTENDWPNQVLKTPDGNFLVVGFSLSSNGDITGNAGGWDGFAVKISGSGSVLWRKTYGGIGAEFLRAAELTDDGGFMLFGCSTSPINGAHGQLDYWLVKTNGQGVLQWQKVYGGSQFEDAQCMAKTTSGDFILTGRSASHDGDVASADPDHTDTDLWTIRVNPSGQLIWERSYGGVSLEVVNALVRDASGGLILGGYSHSKEYTTTQFYGLSDCFVMKITDDGDPVWKRTFGGYDIDQCQALFPTPDGGFVSASTTFSVTGDVTGNHGDYDYWLVKFGTAVGTVEQNSDFNIIRISPNPAVNHLSLQAPERFEPVKTMICNARGVLVFSGRYTADMDVSRLPAGLYTVFIHDKNGAFCSGKFSKISQK